MPIGSEPAELGCELEIDEQEASRNAIGNKSANSAQ
jgi:hypothetical protein